jgi:hypothetical protein
MDLIYNLGFVNINNIKIVLFTYYDKNIIFIICYI